MNKKTKKKKSNKNNKEPHTVKSCAGSGIPGIYATGRVSNTAKKATGRK